jgi:DNA adenine methylase
MMNSPLSWFGGKRLLRKKLIPLIPDHTCFVEVFAGALWFLFGKPESHIEVANDIDDRLINFYNVVKTCPNRFIADMQYDIVSRRQFYIYQKLLEKEKHLDNITRAKLFFYVIKLSFNSHGERFAISTTIKPRLNLSKVHEIIQQAHDRLKRVIIENRDWREIIQLYDREHTFFYLDPPYHVPSAKRYFQYFTDSDFIELSRQLRNIEGKFILSLNDDEFIRKTFQMFNIDVVDAMYHSRKEVTTRTHELVIKNF